MNTESTPVDIATVNGKELIIPVPQKGEFGVPIKLNRQQRRSMERERTGNRGAKAKRHRQVITAPVEDPELTAAREAYEAQQRAFEAAQNLRQATRGTFWLPGDK